MIARRPHERARGGRCQESATSRSAGFTIVELMIVVILASVLGATAVHLFRTQSRLFRIANRGAEVEQNLRAGLDLMLRELRNAGMRDALQSYAARPGILVADAQTIRFTMDIQGTTSPPAQPDGDVSDANEDIEYSYTASDSTLRRRTRGEVGDSGAQPLAESVTGLSFTYLDAGGDTIPTPVAAGSLTDIRRIQVGVAGASPDGATSTTLESDVVPPNLAF